MAKTAKNGDRELATARELDHPSRQNAGLPHTRHRRPDLVLPKTIYILPTASWPYFGVLLKYIYPLSKKDVAEGLPEKNLKGGLQSTLKAQIEFSRDRPRAQIHLATSEALP